MERMQMNICGIYFKSRGNSRYDATYIYQYDIGGMIPKWISNKYMEEDEWKMFSLAEAYINKQKAKK